MVGEFGATCGWFSWWLVRKTLCECLRCRLESRRAQRGRSGLFEEVVDAFFVVAVEVAGEGGLISYELALAQG